ncbi:MAG: ribonuclease E/G [Coriobacteriia bacterium]|nr:ribonuclease E/G [Coriobacteriia bacterium]
MGQSIVIPKKYDIYVGEVKSIKPELNACFVSLDKNDGEASVFVQFPQETNVKHAVTLNQKIVVQITHPERSGKRAKAKTSINLSTHHFALYLDGLKLCGKKINPNFTYTMSDRLSSIQQEKFRNYFNEAIEGELSELAGQLIGPVDIVAKRKASSFSQASYVEALRKIIQDALDLQHEVRNSKTSECIRSLGRIRVTPTIPGYKKLPLRSGGNLVLDKTEAFWAIDVNTGITKAQGEKSAHHIANEEAIEVLCKHVIDSELYGLFVIDLAGDMDEASLQAYCREISLKFKSSSTIYVNYEIRLSLAFFARGM